MNPQREKYYIWPPHQSDEYDDELAVEAYLRHFKRWFMTDLERRCLDIGYEYRKILFIKGDLRAKPPVSQSFETEVRIIEENWNSETNSDVRLMLGNTNDPELLENALRLFSEKVSMRIQKAIDNGEITVNRCPTCYRVVRTPQAKQCMWCKYDWHDRQ